MRPKSNPIAVRQITLPIRLHPRSIVLNLEVRDRVVAVLANLLLEAAAAAGKKVDDDS
jgi:hypothetical protein